MIFKVSMQAGLLHTHFASPSESHRRRCRGCRVRTGCLGSCLVCLYFLLIKNQGKLITQMQMMAFYQKGMRDS